MDRCAMDRERVGFTYFQRGLSHLNIGMEIEAVQHIENARFG